MALRGSAAPPPALPTAVTAELGHTQEPRPLPTQDEPEGSPPAEGLRSPHTSGHRLPLRRSSRAPRHAQLCLHACLLGHLTQGSFSHTDLFESQVLGNTEDGAGEGGRRRPCQLGTASAFPQSDWQHDLRSRVWLEQVTAPSPAFALGPSTPGPRGRNLPPSAAPRAPQGCRVQGTGCGGRKGEPGPPRSQPIPASFRGRADLCWKNISNPFLRSRRHIKIKKHMQTSPELSVTPKRWA